MKTKVVILSLLLPLVANVLFAQPETILQLLMDGTVIKWAYSDGDEFNSNQLDMSKWYTCGDGWNREHGDELQYYKDENITVDNGILKLTAKQEYGCYDVWRFDGGAHTINKCFDYTSGMIQTKLKYKYGLFEIQFKLPAGRGLWPAFWLYGGNPDEEFDIFEYKGENTNKIHINVHHDNIMEPNQWFTLTGGLDGSFNNMMGEWGPNACFWYLNGHEFAIWLGNLNYQETLIANLAIASNGGMFGPGPDNTTPFPSVFEIDYIRIWTRLDCDHDITISNYNQTVTDPTAKTGKNINVSNLTLNQDQSLKLIATESITIEPNTIIQGDFEAKIVDCPNLTKSNNNNYGNLQILDTTNISTASQKSINDSNNVNITSVTNKVERQNKPVLYTKIYPNPTQGKINIEFEGSIDRKIKIELYNSIGVLVFSKEIVDTRSFDIDISDLSKGAYQLKGSFGDNSTSVKIVLN